MLNAQSTLSAPVSYECTGWIFFKKTINVQLVQGGFLVQKKRTLYLNSMG